ncbi:LicD family protein [Vibrio phage 150E35-1]|nr:LicD family protein [Vibrio phage 150E35-1]
MRSVSMRINNGSWTDADRHEFRDKQRELLNRVVKVLNDMEVPYFLSAGTLLGAIRDGEFLLDDSDHDIGIEAQYWNDDIKKALDDAIGGYTSVDTRPNPDKGLVLHQFGGEKFKRKRVYVDVEIYYPFYHDGELCYMNPSLYFYKYPQSVIESGYVSLDLNGDTYSILSDSAGFLDTVYNPTWRAGRDDSMKYGEYPNKIPARESKFEYEFLGERDFKLNGKEYLDICN